ncbi:MAG: hypothetical protein ABIP94_05825, partial [Planctomycetota bacterium]
IMNATSLLSALLSCGLIASVSAQVQIPINPKATYLRTQNDASALPAPAIPLSALGVSAGQWLDISTVGAFSANAGADTSKNLVCVFSSNSTLLTNTAGLQNRVPGAIAAGAAFVTGYTYNSNLSTNLAEDFVVARTGWTNGAIVKVPLGATHIFVSVFNHSTAYTYFTNNADPNSDYFVVFTPGSPATLQGTAEHPELRTGVNGASTALPDVKQAGAFATLSVDLAQRWGVSNGDIWLLAANIFATGGAPPVGPLPDFHMGNDFVVVQVGVITSAPGLWSALVPPGNAGTTVVLQGFFLTSTARNGLLASSNAHRIELQ